MKYIITILLSLILMVGKGQTKPKSEYDIWEQRKNDTANWWQKDASDGINYIIETLPARDTVDCYFQYINGETTVHGRAIETTWVYGYAVRYHERIVGFMYDKKQRAKVTVLTYKLISKP